MNLHVTRLVLFGWLAMASAAAHAQFADGRLADDSSYTGVAASLSGTGQRATVRQTAADVLFAQDEGPIDDLAAPAPPAVMDGQPPVDGVMPIPDGGMGHPGSGAMADGAFIPGASDLGYGMGPCPVDGFGGCPDVWFAQGEILYFDRARNNNAIISEASRLGEFDYEEGYRVTFGQKFDCTDGWEAVLTGMLEWNLANVVQGADLNSFFIPTGVDVSAFNDAVIHGQTYQSEFNSVEFSQKCWAWDVLTQSVGIRYINISEEFRFASLNAAGETGVYAIDTDNHFFGAQYGFDLLYPYYRRWVFGMKTKLGGYMNLADGRATMINDNVLQFDNETEDPQLGFFGELGLHASYKLLPRVTLTGGYEFWYIYGAAFAWEQELYYVSPFTGTNLNTDGDAVYHGATAGVEIVW